MTNTAALVIFTLLLAAGQLLFKQAAQAIARQSIQSMVLILAGSIPLWTAVLLYGGSTVLWVWILSRVPLSQAYPWTALGTIIVPLAATILFGEAVRPIFWLGAATVAVGIVLTQIGSTG